jgi:hypothetical protein
MFDFIFRSRLMLIVNNRAEDKTLD